VLASTLNVPRSAIAFLAAADFGLVVLAIAISINFTSRHSPFWLGQSSSLRR
jgi:hypothetical protein